MHVVLKLRFCQLKNSFNVIVFKIPQNLLNKSSVNPSIFKISALFFKKNAFAS